MGVKNDLTMGIATALNAVRTVFEQESCVYLLKRAGQTEKFQIVCHLTTDFFVEWNEFRQQLGLSIATTDKDFRNLAAQCTHFAYGDQSSEGLNVYVTEDDSRDRIEPDGTSPLWKFYLTRVSNTRFKP